MEVAREVAINDVGGEFLSKHHQSQLNEDVTQLFLNISSNGDDPQSPRCEKSDISRESSKNNTYNNENENEEIVIPKKEKLINLKNNLPIFDHLQIKKNLKWYLNRIFIINSNYSIIFKFEVDNKILKNILIDKNDITFIDSDEFNSSIFIKNIDKKSNIKENFLKLVNDKFINLLDVKFEFIFNTHGVLYSTYNILKNIINFKNIL